MIGTEEVDVGPHFLHRDLLRGICKNQASEISQLFYKLVWGVFVTNPAPHVVTFLSKVSYNCALGIKGMRSSLLLPFRHAPCRTPRYRTQVPRPVTY